MKAHSETSEEQALALPPWNDMTVGNKSRRLKTKPERQLDVLVLMLAEPINDCFDAAVNQRNYRFLKKSSRYDSDVTHEMHNMGQELVAKMKYHPFLC